MNCLVCGRASPSGFKFCGACGASLSGPATGRFDTTTVALLSLNVAFAAANALLTLRVGPMFVRMFADVGQALPDLTVLAIDSRVQLGITAGLILVAAMLLALPRRNDRRLALGLLALLGAARIPLFFVSVYLPIFSLANSIK
jgi:type II secretory pathway component PulF